MKKKFTLLLAVMMLLLSACGSSNESNSSGSQTSAGKDEKIYDVELTIPAGYMNTENTTQEDLDAAAKENDYQSITLNADGSITYIMTKEQHTAMVSSIATTLDSYMESMVGSEDYPNITAVEASSDYTEFTITTTSEELDIAETISRMMFYTYGDMYQVFNGTADNTIITVNFVNADSGEVIANFSSLELEQ